MDKRNLRSKKTRPRNARPYDRQNQSIFGKVCSTVKGLLNPSWLFGVSNWIGNSDEQPQGSSEDIEEETIREDNDVVCQSTSHGNKRLRLRFDENVPSIQSSGTQTWPEQTPQNMYETVSHVQSSSQSCLLENKEPTLPVLNGDDHSENSEGSASTSGCSSLVSSHKESNRLNENPFANLLELKNIRKRKLSSSKSGLNDLDNSRSLWSSNFSPKFHGRLPTISHTNQPSFNLSTFVGSTKMNESMEKKVSSPFYEGRTTFGGASATRRMPPSVTLYQTDRNATQNKIRVREHGSDDTMEGMSSAAKRILLTLEKMSTPVADAQRIPSSDTSPIDLSLYMTPPKSRRNSQLTPSIASKGPPIANINTIAKLATLKNYGTSRLRNTLLSPTPSNSKVEKKTDQQPKPFVFSSPVEPELPNRNAFSKENIYIPSSCDSNAEKKSDTSSKPFVFSSPIEHELPGNSLPKVKTPQKPFIFSTPIEHELPTNKNTVPKNNISFAVHSPMGAAVPSSATWTCSACWASNASNQTSCKACDAPQVSKEINSRQSQAEKNVMNVGGPMKNISDSLGVNCKNAEEIKGNLDGSSSLTVTPTGFSFGTPSSSSAAMFNFGTPQTQNISPSKPLVFGSGANFKNTEMAKTSPSVSTSLAVTSVGFFGTPSSSPAVFSFGTPKTENISSPKPLTFTSGSKTPTWECANCWIRNYEADVKCKACDEVRPQKENLFSKKMNSPPKISSSFSTWECTSCWVRNPAKEKKCMACETLHPSVDITSGFEKPPTMPTVSLTTSLSSQSAPSVSSATPVSSVETIFGSSKTNAKDAASTAFSFGSGLEKSQIVPVTSSQSSSAVSSTKSEIPAVTSTPTSFGSGAVSSGKSSIQPTFKFGTQITGSTTPAVATSNIFTDAKSEVSKLVSSSVSQNTILVDGSSAGNSELKSKTDVQIPSTVSQSSGFTFRPPATFSSSIKNDNTSAALQNTSTAFGTSTTMSATFSNPVPPSGVINAPSTKASDVLSPKGSDIPSTNSFTFGDPTPGLFNFGASIKKIPISSTSTNVSSSSSWECSSCWVRNPQDKTSCMACETPKETSSTLKSKGADEAKNTSIVPAVSSSVTSTGFTFASLGTAPAAFSFGASKLESQTVPSSKTFSFGLDPNVSTWECKSCLTRNPEADTKCKSCKAAQPRKENLNAKSFTFKGFEKPQTTLSASPITSQSVSSGTSAGGFVFGTPKTEVQNAALTPFSFGSGLEKSQTAPSVPSITSQTTTSGQNTGTSASGPSGGFVFGVSKTETLNTAPAPFSFGPGHEKPQNTPIISSASQTTSTSSGLNLPSTPFVFGTSKTEAQNTAAQPFPFGSGAASSNNTSAFSAFQSTQATPVAFKFGSQPPGSTSLNVGTSNTFSFTKSESQIPTSISQNPAPAFGSTPTNFVFGAKSEASNQIPSTVSQPSGISFGSTSNFTFSGKNENNAASQNQTPTFGSTGMHSVFGNTSVQSFSGGDKPASGGFNFGVPSTGVFQFGASSNNGEKKRSAQSSGFSFSGSTAAEPSNSFQAGFTMNTPPSFNFGAASTPGGPFQFAASTAPKTAPSQSAPRKYKKALRRVTRKE